MFGVKNIIFFSSIVENDGSMAAATENNRRKLPSPFDDFFWQKRENGDLTSACILICISGVIWATETYYTSF